MPTKSNTEQVTDSQLSGYAKLIYEKTGIHVSPKKKLLLSNRIRRRLKATSIPTFDAYLRHLSQLAVADEEWDCFLQEITTHETYLFRDEGHWEWFRNEYLPGMVKNARAASAPKKLRIWSAACSTGDEAHTIASCIADRVPNYSQWDIQILGTDIGVDTVNTARQATFSARAMRNVSASYRTRFFSHDKKEDSWKANAKISEMISFRQHNLLEPLREAPFDVVFLKNVMIYFDQDSKKRAIDHVLKAIRPGGLLITGAAEGVSDLLRHLERQTTWLHRKPLLGESLPQNQKAVLK